MEQNNECLVVGKINESLLEYSTRYHKKDSKYDYLLESERKLAKYLGNKYCLGLNLFSEFFSCHKSNTVKIIFFFCLD